jgi:ABC-type iron transport system FetAB ATPase subunit
VSRLTADSDRKSTDYGPSLGLFACIPPALTESGVPVYRTLVQYVPQRPSLLPGTPLDYLRTIRSFRSRQKRPSSRSDGSSAQPDGHHYGSTRGAELDPIEVSSEWGIEKVMWTREWGTLSGGEAQRIALAVAIGVGGAEVVLLDGESPS